MGDNARIVFKSAFGALLLAILAFGGAYTIQMIATAEAQQGRGGISIDPGEGSGALGSDIPAGQGMDVRLDQSADWRGGRLLPSAMPVMTIEEAHDSPPPKLENLLGEGFSGRLVVNEPGKPQRHLDVNVQPAK